MFEIQKWHYNTHKVVLRIPKLVGVNWAIGYGVNLHEFEAVPAYSNFDGSHMGSGNGPELMLALSECGYCLITKIPNTRNEQIQELERML